MKKRIIIVSIGFLFLSGYGCKNKIYPDEKFAFSSAFRNLFIAVARQDSFSFKNVKGDRKTFTKSQIDSVIVNETKLIMNPEPYKKLRVDFKEIGKDTTVLEWPNMLTITKRPLNNVHELSMNFSNLFYADTVLPKMIADSNLNNQARFNHFYIFESAFKAKHVSDVAKVFMDTSNGFLGFETLSGDLWISEKVAD